MKSRRDLDGVYMHVPNIAAQIVIILPEKFIAFVVVFESNIIHHLIKELPRTLTHR